MDSDRACQVKDTVLVAHTVLWWARHVEQDKLRLLGLLHDELIEPHCCMHTPHIRLVPDARHIRSQWVQFTNQSPSCSALLAKKLSILTGSPIP